MKRILVLCMVCMVLFAGVASAEVIKGKDSFTGGVYVGSFVEPPNFFNTMNFTKNISDGSVNYVFSIFRIRDKNNVLGDAPIEFKIDEYPVYKLDDYKYKINGPDSYGVEYSSYIDAKLPGEMAEKIKIAKRVAIRFEEVNGMRWPYVLPDNVLDEWKQVINTTGEK